MLTLECFGVRLRKIFHEPTLCLRLQVVMQHGDLEQLGAGKRSPSQPLAYNPSPITSTTPTHPTSTQQPPQPPNRNPNRNSITHISSGSGGRHGRGATEEDDEDEGRGGQQRVQCANQ